MSLSFLCCGKLHSMGKCTYSMGGCSGLTSYAAETTLIYPNFYIDFLLLISSANKSHLQIQTWNFRSLLRAICNQTSALQRVLFRHVRCRQDDQQIFILRSLRAPLTIPLVHISLLFGGFAPSVFAHLGELLNRPRQGRTNTAEV